MTKYRKKSSRFDWDNVKPQLPIDFGPQSNGEFFYEPDARDRLIEKVALEMAEENAKRAGLDRRSFLGWRRRFLRYSSWPAVATTARAARPAPVVAGTLVVSEAWARSRATSTAPVRSSIHRRCF